MSARLGLVVSIVSIALLGTVLSPAVRAQPQPEGASLTIDIVRSTAQATVTLLDDGVTQVCIQPEALCFGIGPFDFQAELSRPTYLGGDIAGLQVQSWNLSDIRPLQPTLEGRPCDDTMFCEVGGGYLILLQRPGGELVAGRMVRGDDYAPELSRIVSGPIGAYPSTLWLETRSACGGVCQRFHWEVLHVNVSAGTIQSLAGPFQTGVEDGEMIGDQLCIESTRIGPLVDLATGALYVPTEVELGDRSVRWIELRFNPVGNTLEEIGREERELPRSRRRCERQPG